MHQGQQPTHAMLTHFQVLQEESERICGKALPAEIVLMILYKWGGLETPTARIVWKLMNTTIHNTLGQSLRFVPHGTFSKGELGGFLTEEQLRNRSTVFVSHIPTAIILRSVGVEGVDMRLLSPYSTAMWQTTKGPIFVQPACSFRLSFRLSERTTPSSIWKWQGLDTWMEPPGAGMRMRSTYLWAMAAQCRGVPEPYVRLCYRARDPPSATKSELYQLVLRAETDYTWRFWYDLVSTNPEFCWPVTVGHIIGVALSAGVIGCGARYLQSKIA